MQCTFVLDESRTILAHTSIHSLKNVYPCWSPHENNNDIYWCRCRCRCVCVSVCTTYEAQNTTHKCTQFLCQRIYVSNGNGSSLHRTNCVWVHIFFFFYLLFLYSSISSISFIVVVDLVTFSVSFAPYVRRCRCICSFFKTEKRQRSLFFVVFFDLCKCLRRVCPVCVCLCGAVRI